MDKKRLNTFLLLTFMFSLVMLWDAWEKKNAPPPPTETSASAPMPAPAASNAAGSVPSASSAHAQSATQASVPGAGPKASLPAIDVAKATITTDLLKVEVSAQGGDIVHVELLTHRSTLDPSKHFVLLENNAEHIYVAQSGLMGEGMPNHRTMFDLGGKTDYALQPGQDKLELRLSAVAANGVRVAKVYTFTRGSYLIDVRYEVTNTLDTPFEPHLYFQIVRDGKEPESSTSGAFGVITFSGPAVYTEEHKFQKIKFDEINKGKAKFADKANNGWIGLVQHYFVSAWLPQGNVPREFYIDKLGELYRAGVKFPLEAVAPGATVNWSVPLYAGPQQQDKLATIAPGFDLVVDYGWLTMIAAPLFWVMQKLHSWIGNWGWTIIALTILLKLAFFKLSATSYKSMAKMRLVMPQMSKLKEIYKDDRTKLNQEMMELYKREKINPLGGCLPILVQIPVFIALYWVLLGTVEIRNAPWLGWITDLSVKDPYFVLPILMGLTMLFQTRLNPTPPDPIQAKVMTWMPVLFTFMFLWFPSGLVLYWTVNNLLSIAQQWFITKKIESGAKPAK